MNPEEARRRFSQAQVARLASVGPDGHPHLVPMVFALTGETLYSAVDAKPKRSSSLRRLANIAANPAVAVLVDHYSDDWETLWWARADGSGRILEPDSAESEEALDLLTHRYQQYRIVRPPGPVVAIDVQRWSGWVARP